MPERMWAYDRFADLHHWDPRTVDRLDLDEMFWLPVMADAKAEAISTYRELHSDD
jgi:hypothetical protein